MRVYDRYILPRLTHLAMRQDLLLPYRLRAVSGAKGRVLEIGIGSGLNLPLYPNAVEHVVGLDPSPELLGLIDTASGKAPPDVDLVRGAAEDLPLEDATFDCVIASWTLCSVSNPRRALSEIRRVLKPGGTFGFVEHGLSPEAGVRKWQRRLTPLWCRCAGNCHLDRDPAAMVEESGLRTARLETGYAPGPRPFTFMYEGLSHRD